MEPSLELMLSRVQAIKERYYVGTAEIIPMIRAEHVAREKAQHIANTVNAQILPFPLYAATPERLSAILSILEHAYYAQLRYHAHDLEYEPALTSGELDTAEQGIFQAYNDYRDIFSPTEPDDKFDKRLVQNAAALFQKANRAKIKSDPAFFLFVTDSVHSLASSLSDSEQEYIADALKNTWFDFNDNHEAQIAARYGPDTLLDPHAIWARMKQEHVDHEKKLRMQLAKHCVRYLMSRGKSFCMTIPDPELSSCEPEEAYTQLLSDMHHPHSDLDTMLVREKNRVLPMINSYQKEQS